MIRVAKVDMPVCPCCKAGRLRTIAVLARQARLPPPCTTGLPPGRGRGEAVALGHQRRDIDKAPDGVRRRPARDACDAIIEAPTMRTVSMATRSYASIALET